MVVILFCSETIVNQMREKSPAIDINEQYKPHSAEIDNASQNLSNMEVNVFTINELYYCCI